MIHRGARRGLMEKMLRRSALIERYALCSNVTSWDSPITSFHIILCDLRALRGMNNADYDTR